MSPDAEVTAASEVFGAVELAHRCAELEAQRDRARDIAVALEGQVAALTIMLDGFAGGVPDLDAEETWRP